MKGELRICILLVLFAAEVLPRSALCAPEPGMVYQREDLYHEGLKAYKSNDYVTALEDLFAFEMLNDDQLRKSSSEELKSFKSTLTAAITYSEDRLRSRR
jgi:hypothetical protein